MRKLFCGACNKNCNCTTRTEKETYPVKGENITINAQVSYCTECGAQVWDPIHDEKNLAEAFDEYRRTHCLLLPKEIKAIRDKYQLSQMSFGRILGLGDKTIARYETGSIQDVAQNNLIQLADDPNNFELLLKRNPLVLSDPEREKLIQIITALKGESIGEIKYEIQYKPYVIVVPEFSFVGE